MKLRLRPAAKRPVSDTMTITEHLSELRMRIIRCALAITIGFVVVLAFYNPILNFIVKPLKEICESAKNFECDGSVFFFSPLEGFGTRIRIATYGGFILGMPVLLWQIWRFIVPGLHQNERRYAIPFIVSAVLLFALGGYIAWWTLPQALEFLFQFAGDATTPLLGVAEYVKLVALMVLAFGVGLEFPLLLVFLQLAGVLSYRTLLKNWRFAIVGVVIIAAVITPSGDPISLAALAIPMTVLYFAAAILGRTVQRRREKAAAT